MCSLGKKVTGKEDKCKDTSVYLVFFRTARRPVSKRATKRV